MGINAGALIRHSNIYIYIDIGISANQLIILYVYPPVESDTSSASKCNLSDIYFVVNGMLSLDMLY